MKKLTSDFMIGAATAAHQVEGNNVNSDFWTMEHVPFTMYKEPSLDAVNHYHKYKEDIQLLVDAGCNTYRFSIEWARIELTKGNFDQKEIEHYR
jgi:beta-glucosidase